MPNLNKRSLFYWKKGTYDSTGATPQEKWPGYWVEVTTGGETAETLAANINDTTNTITISSPNPNPLPIKAGDKINLGTERMHVTAKSGTTLTVLRGLDGTKGISHLSGDTITIGVEALVESTVNDSMHNPRQGKFLLVNTATNIFSTTGVLSGVFEAFTKILVYDKGTNQLVYVGYIRDLRDSWSAAMGRVITITASDILTELLNFPTNNPRRFGTKGELTALYVSDQIKELIGDTQLDVVTHSTTKGNYPREHGNALLLSSDYNTVPATDGYKLFDRSVDDSAGKYTVSRGGWNLLQHINFLSSTDSHESDADTNQTYAYDFYVTPYFIKPRPDTGAWTDNPNWHFNYFKRGQRFNFTQDTYGLHIKYPLTDSDSDRAARPGATSPLNKAMRMMVYDTDFRQVTENLYTTASVTYNGRLDKPLSGDISKQKEFELLYCYNLRVGSKAACGDANMSDADYYNNHNGGWPIWSNRLIDTVDNGALSGKNDGAGQEVIADNSATQSYNETVNRENAPVAAELLKVEYWDGDSWEAYAGGNSVARLAWLSTDVLTSVPSGNIYDYYKAGAASVDAQANNTAVTDNFNAQGNVPPTTSKAAIRMLVSFDDDDIQNTMTNFDGLIQFVGLTSNFTIQMNNKVTLDTFWKGRPRNVLGMMGKVKKMTVMDKVALNDIRQEIAKGLVSNTTDVRTGKSKITSFPYSMLDARIGTVASSNPDVNTKKLITLKEYASETAVNAGLYGIKSGAVIQIYNESAMTGGKYLDSGFQTHGVVESINPSYQPAGLLTVNFSTSTNALIPAAGDYVRLYMPLRAGDAARVNNAVEGILGNHLIEKTHFSETTSAFLTEINSVGSNEVIDIANLPGIDPSISASPATAGEYLSSLPGGQQSAYFEGKVYVEASGSVTKSNSVSWGRILGNNTAIESQVILGDGRIFRINPGKTHTAKHKKDGTTIGALSTSADTGLGIVADGLTDDRTVEYTVYLDTGDTPTNGLYDLHVAPSTKTGSAVHQGSTGTLQFQQTSDRIVLFYVRSGIPATGANAVDAEWRMHGGSSGWNVTTVKQLAPSIIVPDSFSATLTKKSLQPYTTNISIYPGKHTADNNPAGETATPDNLQRYVHFTNGAAGTAIPGTISFADDATVPLTALNSLDLTTIPLKTRYIYFRLLNSSGGETSNFADVTTASISSSDTYSDATSDSRGLLAICTTGTNTTTSSPYDEIAIQAFHGKGQNITADVIAANAITSNHIHSDRISGNKLSIDGNAVFASGWRGTAAGENETYLPKLFVQSAFPVGATGTANHEKIAIGDIWLDSDDGKVYKANANSNANFAEANWVAQHNGDGIFEPTGSGATTFTNVLANPPTQNNAGQTSPYSASTPAVNSKQYDTWVTSDTNQLYIALHATTNDTIASGKWTLKDDADAINNATTTIRGGLINTQRIKLVKGGGLAGAMQPNVMQNDAGVTRAPVNTIRQLNAALSNATETELTIDAFETNDLRIYAGDVIRLPKTAGGFEDMYVKKVSGTNDVTLEVIRGYNGTTAGACSNNGAIYKYMDDLLTAALNNGTAETGPEREIRHNAGLSNPHIIMDNYGIVGYSDAYTTEFSISSEDGKGVFGGGVGTIDSLGMKVTTGSGATMQQVFAGADGTLHVGDVTGSSNGGTFINNNAILAVGSHNTNTGSGGAFGDMDGNVAKVGIIKAGGGSTTTGRFQLWVGGSDATHANYLAKENVVADTFGWKLTDTALPSGSSNVPRADLITILGSTDTDGAYAGKYLISLAQPYSDANYSGWGAFAPARYGKATPVGGTSMRGNGWLGAKNFAWSGLYLEAQDTNDQSPQDLSNNAEEGVLFLRRSATSSGVMSARVNYREGSTDRTLYLLGGHSTSPALGDGTAASPTYTFSDQTNAGFYREGNNILGLVTNGQGQVAFDGTSGRLALRLDNNYTDSVAPSSWDYPTVFYSGNRNTGFGYYTSSTYAGTIFYSNGATAAIIGYGSATYKMYINGGLQITGALSKGSGTFKIAHPLDEDNKTLVHGFIEAPRHDLIYRGTATLSSGTVTASIDTASNMTSGTFVALTKNPEIWVQNKTGWTAVRGQVSGGNVIITAQDSSCTDTVAWLVMAERDDTFIKSDGEPWTDNNGTFIPEWNNSDLDK